MKGQPKKDFLPSQNGIAKKVSDDIELLNTDALVKEVCMMNSANSVNFSAIYMHYICQC